MNDKLKGIIENIGTEFKAKILKGSRHYVEISIGQRAAELGHHELEAPYRKTYAVVPLKEPESGMKVRIDGRTFVDYAEYESGVAVPGYLARKAGKKYRTFVPPDSMICNFT